jgi:putative GTP pyrophosphokinase
MKLTNPERKLIEELVDCYEQQQSKLKTFLEQITPVLQNSEQLKEIVHSFKWRLKDPDHLRDKLRRKIQECKVKDKKFQITCSNLFINVTDLVGLRILHLHTRQTAKIDKILRVILKENGFRIIEGPFARTWDDETKAFFNEIGIGTRQSGPSMYTSVHYIIDSNSRTRFTAEIQVRTLAEELWGEVAHTIDYPTPSKSLSCKEQIRVLARVTSSCTRLVDSIFRSHEDFNSPKRRRRQS